MIILGRFHVHDNRLFRRLVKIGNAAGWLTLAFAIAIMALHVAPQVFGMGSGWQ